MKFISLRRYGCNKSSQRDNFLDHGGTRMGPTVGKMNQHGVVWGPLRFHPFRSPPSLACSPSGVTPGSVHLSCWPRCLGWGTA